MINLKRRPERHEHMKNTLRELGLKWTYFEAVDGRLVKNYQTQIFDRKKWIQRENRNRNKNNYRLGTGLGS